MKKMEKRKCRKRRSENEEDGKEKMKKTEMRKEEDGKEKIKTTGKRRKQRKRKIKIVIMIIKNKIME